MFKRVITLALVLVAGMSPWPAAGFGIGLPREATVVEYHNRLLDHYFLTADQAEMAGIESGSAGPGWRRTGYAFRAWDTSGWIHSGLARIERFYGTPGLGPNSHFYTGDAAEADGLRAPGSGWTYEKTAFLSETPLPNGQCEAPVFRLYNGRWMFNDSNHRYVTSERVRLSMIASGWADEGVKFCAQVADVPFKSFDVHIPLSHRILPSAQCEDESQGIGPCLAVNNLPVPASRAGPFGPEASSIFASVSGAYSAEVYAPAGGFGAAPEAVAEGIFVNGNETFMGVHVETRGRDASSYASINPLYQMRTTPGPGTNDERFFPFVPRDLPSAADLSIRFVLHVRRINVHDASSHAYGHPTVEFIDVKSGEHLYFTVLAYGRPSGADYLAPDVGTGKVIVGTEFRASTPYGRSIGAAALFTPPGFDAEAAGDFDFRMDRAEFQRVIDDARRINPRLSTDPSDYLVDNFHFNNEVVGNAEIGASIGGFSLRLMPRR